MFLENCPVCGAARNTDTLGGRCPHCFNHIGEEMKRLGIDIPEKWKYFYEYEDGVIRTKPDSSDLVTYASCKITTARQLVEARKKYSGAELQAREEEIRKYGERREREIVDGTYERLLAILENARRIVREREAEEEAVRNALREL